MLQAKRCKKCLWHTSLLKKYIEKYNFVRPHCSLGYRTPAEVAYRYATVRGNSGKNSEVVLDNVL
ncbi:MULTISPECIES: transposase [unclassified Hydrogenobaculum]|uniref:transposase n=1 Tax=unclassified Hydrogenobaculum TaxID=2622382 RepID=UPI001ED92BCB|nr:MULTISPECIES: transposase [unclassified Hydrogenobaculum]